MKSYNIFPGISREDELVAAPVYFPEDYPGDPEEYKDYLLERDAFLCDLAHTDAVRIIEFPFSAPRFKKWLASNPQWEKVDVYEAHSAWALDVAKDPGELAAVVKERPCLPAPPFGEEIGTLVLYGIVPTVLEIDATVNPMGGRLPEELTNLVLAEFRRLLSACPPYRRLSRLRCTGLKVHVGDRFVAPDAAEEFEDYVRSGAVRDLEEPVLHVPRRFRPHTVDGNYEGEALFTFSLLPVVLVGSGVELDYCEGLFKKSISFDSEKINGAVRELVRQRLGVIMDGPVPFCLLDEALCLMEQAVTNTVLEEADAGEYSCGEVPKGRKKKAPGAPHLKRVK